MAAKTQYNLKNAKEYFEEHLCVGDYYTEGCRDENFAREPSMQDALAYEVIYGRPVCELFAGRYQQAEQDVAARAKILNFRKFRRPDGRKQAAIIQLAAKVSDNQSNK